MITASVSIDNALPGIVPTVRDYDMGQWPQGKMKMRNGRVQRWGLSSIPTGDKMRLVWENITYAQAESLCIVWDQNYGIYGEVLLPPETLAGTSEELAALLAGPFAGATWQFSAPPKVVAVKARRCTVEMPISVRGFVRQDLDIGDGIPSTYDGCNTCEDDDNCSPCYVGGARISVSVSPLQVFEVGGIPLVFTFELSAPLDFATTVNYTMSGTATNGADYTGSAVTGTRTIPSGQLTAVVTIVPATDALIEGSETVVVSITSAVVNGGSLAVNVGTATGIIADPELPTPLGPMERIPIPGGPAGVPPAGVCAGAVVTRRLANIGDEENAIVETGGNELYSIPLTPPVALGGSNWIGKSVSYSFECPDGTIQAADPVISPRPRDGGTFDVSGRGTMYITLTQNRSGTRRACNGSYLNTFTPTSSTATRTGISSITVEGIDYTYNESLLCGHGQIYYSSPAASVSIPGEPYPAISVFSGLVYIAFDEWIYSVSRDVTVEFADNPGVQVPIENLPRLS